MFELVAVLSTPTNQPTDHQGITCTLDTQQPSHLRPLLLSLTCLAHCSLVSLPRIMSDNEQGEPPTKDEKTHRRRKRKRSKKEAPADAETEPADPTSNEAPQDDSKSLQVDRTVYIEGIPYNCTESDLQDFWKEHKIDLETIEDCRLPVWQDTGRLRGYGHVVFTSKAIQQEAIKLSGKYLKGRYLNIQAANPPKAVNTSDRTLGEPSKTVSLHNLSYKATEDDIAAVMEDYGKILPGGLRVVRESATFKEGQTPRSKGFAYVEYENIESAKKAVQASIVILGRPCRVDYDHGRVRGSFRGASGRFWSTEYGNKRNKTQYDR
jgi:nucleolin